MRKYAFLIATIAIVGVAVLLGAMNNAQAAQPEPLSLVTPVAATARNVDQNGELAFVTTKVFTADGNSTGLNVQNIDVVDLQTVADQTLIAAAANTVTLKLQFSNDGVNWVDGATVLTANAADATDMTQQAVYGKLARINVDVSNTNPVTLSVIAIGK